MDRLSIIYKQVRIVDEQNKLSNMQAGQDSGQGLRNIGTSRTG